MSKPSRSSALMSLVRRARDAVSGELEKLPPGEPILPELQRRFQRVLGLRAQDVRGWPLHLARRVRLERDLRALLPWPEHEYERVLLAGHLPPVPTAPAVSVVIPVYGKLDYTIRCLLSLGACKERTSYEIIVVDDGSPDRTREVLTRCPGIRYFRNETNLGFVGSCNRGASEARGRHLHFLNNDTVALPGWLDRLVETMESTPGAGLVGSRLIYPHLALQESGGVVWRDASATNWGNGRDPFNPTYGSLRDADYCSAASVLVDRALFEAVGGFDARYAPAYYEDTDLAFAVRARGRRVLVQPASRIIHHEGATAGTDLAAGAKRYQVKNQVTFRTKWASTLETHGYSGDTSAHVLDRHSKRTVLVLATATPRPDQDSGSVDLANLLRLFRDLSCRTIFMPVMPVPRFVPVPDVRPDDGAYTEALQRIGVECPHFPYEPSVERYLAANGADVDVVVLVRYGVADRYLSAVRKHCPRARVVFYTVDLHYLRERRHAEHLASTWHRWLAADTERRELRAVADADMTLVLSTVEKTMLEQQVPHAELRILPLIREIPGRMTPLAGRSGVLFVGGFKHLPNVDAVQYLVKEIWPRVRARIPGTKLHVVGSSTPDEIRALATDDVVVHGYVADLAPLHAQCRVSVAPLRFGAGLKGKVASSLAYGVPCVTTSMGAEGSGLENEREVLVEDDPERFADAIVRAHTDDVLWMRLSTAGLAFVESEYSLAANRERLAVLFEDLGVA